MNNEHTYIKRLPHSMVRQLGAAQAVLAATIGEMCDATETGEREISGAYLMEILGYEERKKLRRHIQELRDAEIINYKSGDGRGHVTLFKKGDKFAPLYSIKGDKNTPPCNDKGGQNCTIKGGKNDPLIIKNNNKNNKCPKGHNMCACAQKEDLFLKAVLGDTPKPPKSSRYPFGLWWLTFKPLGIYKSEKEDCEKIWQYLRKEKKEEAFVGIETSRILSPLQYLLQFKDTYECIGADEYYKRYQTDRERDGWKRIYMPSKKRTIYKRVKK